MVDVSTWSLNNGKVLLSTRIRFVHRTLYGGCPVAP